MRSLVTITLIIVSLSQLVEGVKRMKEYPFPAYEYGFDKPVIFMFPMIRPNTIGIYYGLEDHENVAAVVLKEHGLDKDVYKFEDFDGYMTGVYPQIDPDFLTITQKSSIGVLNFAKGKQDVDYQPKMPDFNTDGEFSTGKVLMDGSNKVVSGFYPFINETNEYVLCQSIVLEDLSEKKTLKRLQVRNNNPPFITFFSNATVFRDGMVGAKYLEWKAIDDTLEPAQHPLVQVLNDFNKMFFIDYFQASECQECAVVSGYPKFPGDKYGPTQLQIVPWEKDRPPIPIHLPDGLRPSQYISRETFILSPSGKWLFFVAAKPGKPVQGPDQYFLMYIDKTIPNYYLPPIKIETGGDDFKVTWMQEPEGFVLHDGKHLRYWDLSKFDPGKMNGMVK